ICNPARSFTDWPGFMNSALPRMVQPVASDARLSLMRGVLPMESMRSLRISMTLIPAARIVGTLMERRGADKRRAERDDFSSNRHPAVRFLLEHDLFRKPVPTFRDHALVAFEHRFGLGCEGLVGAGEIPGLHADGLGLRLGLDRLVEPHAPFLVQAALG